MTGENQGGWEGEDQHRAYITNGRVYEINFL